MNTVVVRTDYAMYGVQCAVSSLSVHVFYAVRRIRGLTNRHRSLLTFNLRRLVTHSECKSTMDVALEVSWMCR